MNPRDRLVRTLSRWAIAVVVVVIVEIAGGRTLVALDIVGRLMQRSFLVPGTALLLGVVVWRIGAWLVLPVVASVALARALVEYGRSRR